MFDSPKNKKLTGPILYGTTHNWVNKIEGVSLQFHLPIYYRIITLICT